MSELCAAIVGRCASNSTMCAPGPNAMCRGYGHRVELVLYKRRFWCLRCHRAFTESDSACGRRKRTTVRLREEIGKLACSRPPVACGQPLRGGSALCASMSRGRGQYSARQARIEPGGERAVAGPTLVFALRNLLDARDTATTPSCATWRPVRCSK